MKNWKKLLSLGLAVALSAGILTGCGSKEETAADDLQQKLQMRQTVLQTLQREMKYIVHSMRSRKAVRSISAYSQTKTHLVM